MEDNNKHKIIDTKLPASAASIVVNNASKWFELDNTQSSYLTATLDKNTTATLVGQVKAQALGQSTLVISFTFNEMEQPVEITLTTEVVQVTLQAEMVKAIPQHVVVNSEHDLEFLIKNTSLLDATNIQMVLGNLPESATIEEENSEDNVLIDGVVRRTIVEFNQLDPSARKLDKARQFRIKARIKINQAGLFDLGTLITFDEAKTLDDPTEQAGVKLTGGVDNQQPITAEHITMISAITSPLPLKVKLGSQHVVKVTFTNQSESFPVTGINITVGEQLVPSNSWV